MGVSTCRMCGTPNGAGEFTDGVYVWPEGLAHYVQEHSVRLPAEFLAHVEWRSREQESAERDLAWWLEQTRR